MLPPANRLKKEKEIKRVLSGGKSCQAGLLACKTAASGLDAARFCFIVSSRVSGKAVVRNRVKRRLREVARLLMPRVRPGLDVVIIACPGAQTKKINELAQAAEKALARLGALRQIKNQNEPL